MKKSRISIITVLIVSLLFSLSPVNAHAGVEIQTSRYDNEYNYTGTQQTFTANYAGYYRFTLYGAQGGACSGGKAGGLGGMTEVVLLLNKGDNVVINVGGQNGWNGGGTGNVSTGGGATDIRINGTKVAIAGGGGGGTKSKAGGAGGATDSGNATNAADSSRTDSGSAGGGGGYKSGIAGYRTTHTHSSGCYSTCTGTLNWGNANNDGLSVGSCSSCGRQVTASGQAPGAHPDDHNGNKCGISIKTCTKTSTDTASYGGSSWYDTSVCTLELQTPGVRTGDGFCGVKLVKKLTFFYNNKPCLKLYYNNVEVKKLYYDNVLILDNSTPGSTGPGEVTIF